MSRILIKYATRGRSQYFLKAISNIMFTIHDQNYMILVSIDDDDLSMANDNMNALFMTNDNLLLCTGPHETKISAINRDMDKAGDWDILVNMSDDFFFVQPGWDNHVRQRAKDNWPNSLDWVAHFNDGVCGDALPTMSVMGREYYERDRYIYHPSYKSFSCDAEFMYVAMMRGKYKYFPEIIAKHQHPSSSPMPNDEVYRINSTYTDQDTKTYFHRLRNFFDEKNGHEILLARPELKKYLLS